MAKAYNPIGWENGTKEADAYVTIGGVDYDVTPEQWDGNTPVDATNLDHMEKGIQNSYDVKIIAYTDTEPSECATGDVYYNTTNKLLYTATGTDTWSSTGTEPLEGILYILFDSETETGTSYSWDGSDLISVGGGGGGSSDIIIVEPDEPTEETKLVIEEEDLDFQYQTGDTLPVGSEVDVPDDTTIPDGWVEVEDNHTKTVYKARMSTGQSATYTIEEEGMYLVIAHTNGDNRCIMDVIIYVNRTINATRIKDETNPYKSITYSGNVVTMNNTQYTGMYSIIKLY